MNARIGMLVLIDVCFFFFFLIGYFGNTIR